MLQYLKLYIFHFNACISISVTMSYTLCLKGTTVPFSSAMSSFNFVRYFLFVILACLI
uniref:Uncharacterized protein n=1 Tax=Anguilla anguilla TaxID=7936 RepID=A0A0E9UGH7_ANGAN